MSTVKNEPAAAAGTTVDFSRTFHVDVGSSSICVRVWSENAAGFEEPVDAAEMQTALRAILGGRAPETTFAPENLHVTLP